MCTQRCQNGGKGGGHRSAPNCYGADIWVPTLGPLSLCLVCGICIGFASDACRICVDFVGFAFLGVSKTYGNIKKAIGFIPPHLPFYNIKRGKATQPLGRLAQLMPTNTTNLVLEFYKSPSPSTLSVCLSISLSRLLFRSVFLSFCLSVFPSVCLSVFLGVRVGFRLSMSAPLFLAFLCLSFPLSLSLPLLSLSPLAIFVSSPLRPPPAPSPCISIFAPADPPAPPQFGKSVT